MKTILKYLFLFVFVVLLADAFGQVPGTYCNNAIAFCTGTSYNFPAGTNTPPAPATGSPGPMYGCLGTQPNPVWYYMQVGVSGNIEFYMQGTGPNDIDFACWGPFTSPTAPCLSGLTAGSPTPTHHAAGPSPDYPSANMIDCSFSASFEEWCYIPNAVIGQYYLLLITNYSNLTQNIIFSQTNVGQPNAGIANCALLPPNTSNNGPVCEGDTIKLTANSIPTAQYVWAGPNNWTSYQQNPVIPNATAANAGIYYLLFTVGSQISPESQTTVVVKPKPNVIIVSDTICIGDTATITASGANSYLWSPGGLTTSSLKLTPGVTTSYSVTGTSLGCKKTVSAVVKVNQNPVVTASNDSICINDTAKLFAYGASSYKWNNSITSDSLIVSPLINSIYSVVGTDTNNCVDSTFSSVVVYPLPVVQLTPNTTICLGKNITLTAGGGVSYLWNTSPDDTNSYIIVTPTLPTTTYAVGVKDINNCIDSASVDVNTILLPVPTISIEADTICKGSNTTIIAGGGNSYHWNTGEITPSIIASPLQTFIYDVAISTTLNGIHCSIDTSIQLYVRECNLIFIPNTFSPFGYNTIFKPVGEIVISKSYYFVIYNRWGQKMFETKDFNQGWDGRFNGDYVPDGAYVYYIIVDTGFEGAYNRVGTVTIVK